MCRPANLEEVADVEFTFNTRESDDLSQPDTDPAPLLKPDWAFLESVGSKNYISCKIQDVGLTFVFKRLHVFPSPPPSSDACFIDLLM